MKSLALLALLHVAHAQYQLVKEYSGSSFFSGWDFYGNYDNLTNGDAIFVNQANATSQHLAYVNSAGNAVIKVDNTSNVLYNYKRNAVRISTQASYPLGSVILFNALHLPYGCSVWPSFWTKGVNWPVGGEIDIFETVNLMNHNQMALHTTTGCTKAPGTNQTGTNGVTDCSQPAGCVVAESSLNSVGSPFAQAGGGVWATQFDVSGVFIWFWSRANVPSNIQQSSSTLDTSTWGPPSAAYPSSTCNMAQFFTNQQLVLDITLCGDWAGVPSIYNATCANTGTTGLCYQDNVIGPGSPRYDNAYFEVSYVRVYSLNSVASSVSASLASASASAASSSTSPGAGSAASSTSAASKYSWSFSTLLLALLAPFL